MRLLDSPKGGSHSRDSAISPAAAPRLQLRLLRRFELACGGEKMPLPLPAQRLLAFLALQDQPTTRTRAAATLWLDTTDARASGSLRSALWRIHRLGVDLVDATDHKLSLAADISVDVREAMTAIRCILDPACNLDGIDLNKALAAGELLPDWYDDWLAVEREKFRQFRAHALDVLCERLIASGRLSAAIAAALAAVENDPLRESAHRELIKIHLAEGNVAEAIREYDFYRRLLRDKLAIKPSELMQQLVRGLI
jgi:DNA-binding SARP family transcriptional activator